jgi:hypothetical protein
MNTEIYLIRAVSLITVGVIIANIVLESDAMRKLSPLIRPFCRASNLPREGAISLFTAFFNPTAGKATLAGFYQEHKIGDTETILTVVMSTFPIVVGESLFRVHVPVALALLGLRIGSIYLALSFLSAFIQSFAAFIYAKLRFPPQACGAEDIYADTKETAKNQKLKTALSKSFATLKRVLPIMVVAFLIIDVLFSYGIMDHVSVVFDPVLRVLDLPGVVITALVADLAHFSAGYAIVAALLAEEVISPKQAILTLLIGSMLLITMVYLKYSLSMYLSLFGKLGVKIAAINYASSMIAKVLMILLVVVVM